MGIDFLVLDGLGCVVFGFCGWGDLLWLLVLGGLV